MCEPKQARLRLHHEIDDVSDKMPCRVDRMRPEGRFQGSSRCPRNHALPRNKPLVVSSFPSLQISHSLSLSHPLPQHPLDPPMEKRETGIETAPSGRHCHQCSRPWNISAPGGREASEWVDHFIDHATFSQKLLYTVRLYSDSVKGVFMYIYLKRDIRIKLVVR